MNFLNTFLEKTIKTTAFAEFIRSAPAREKKRVYSVVLKKATDRQLDVIRKAQTAQ
jgi:hypothetical protein